MLLRNHVAVAGSTPPMVVGRLPSPSQSPATGIQPGAPKLNGNRLALPEELSVRWNHVAEAGLKTPTVVRGDRGKVVAAPCSYAPMSGVPCRSWSVRSTATPLPVAALTAAE